MCLICCRTCAINICTGSYLDYPRIHFSGLYTANVNTVNNDLNNYKHSLPLENINQGWNPSGGNEWSLQGCVVTSVVYFNGSRSLNAEIEPLIGASVHSNPHSVEGKIVGIDVDAWNKSALFGVSLGVKQSKLSDEYGFIGNLLPFSVIHQNSWYQVPCSSEYISDSHDIYGARSASKLTNVHWETPLDSEVLKQLKQVSLRYGGQLSVSFTMYDYTRDSTAGNFSFGRISGTIGYAHPREPRFFEGERLLSFEFVDQPHVSLPVDDPCSGKKYTPLWAYRAPFKLQSQRNVLTVDFSGSFTRNMVGAIRDIGVLYLAILHANKGTSMCVDTIASIDYHDDRCRSINGCIMDYYLTTTQFKLLQDHTLVVIKSLTNLEPTLTTYPTCSYHPTNFDMFSYNSEKMIAVMLEQWYYVRPYNYYTFMMEKGGVAVADLFVTFLGRPAYGKEIQLIPSSTSIKPIDGLWYNRHALVDEYGYARFMFRANSIKDNPRQDFDLDGQVYHFMYFVKGEPVFCPSDVIFIADEDSTCLETISIKVFSDVSYDEGQHNWVDHVHPIFAQYARIYPIMSKAVNLGSYDDVTQPHVIKLLNFSMQLDMNHPNYMPVSRDLSSVKRKMILEWLSKPCYNSSHCIIHHNDEVGNDSSTANSSIPRPMLEICQDVSSFHQQPHDFNSYYKFTTASVQTDDCITELKQSWCSPYIVRHCLQKAFELEFYTIPLYLTALYSIKDGFNTQVYTIIRSIVMQEMLHMVQVGNLLISIGGSPVLNNANNAPTYPTEGLSGGVLPKLKLSLRRASLDHIYTAFMAVEYPHEVIDSQLGIDTIQSRTIGQLYKELQACLIRHGDSIFYPNRTVLQVKWPYSNDYGTVYVVRDLATALEAIKEITEQGEGVRPGDPLGYQRHDLAHFFKFQEIVCGRELIFHGISNYSYTGRTIPFDENGVWPMRDNPSSVGIIPGTKAYYRTKLFHHAYRSLLAKLDSIFTGNPKSVTEALSIMESLEIQAKLLMALPLNESYPNGETCGPIFDYYW